MCVDRAAIRSDDRDGGPKIDASGLHMSWETELLSA